MRQRQAFAVSVFSLSLCVTLFLSLSSPSLASTLGSKLLLVDQTQPDGTQTPSFIFVTKVLDAIGISFDKYILDVSCTVPATNDLVAKMNDQSSSDYYGIILTHTNLKSYVVNTCQQPAIAIQAYQVRNSIRIVRLGGAPYYTEGTFFVSAYERSVNANGGSVADSAFSDIVVSGVPKAQLIQFTDFGRRLLAGSMYRKSGVKADLGVPTKDIPIIHYPVQVSGVCNQG